MLSYCYKCRKYTESKKLGATETTEANIIIISNCAACDKKVEIYQTTRSKWIIK